MKEYRFEDGSAFEPPAGPAKPFVPDRGFEERCYPWIKIITTPAGIVAREALPAGVQAYAYRLDAGGRFSYSPSYSPGRNHWVPVHALKVPDRFRVPLLRAAIDGGFETIRVIETENP